MPDILSKLFRPKRSGWRPSLPAGQRVYAIGDIHGRLDLFGALVQAIENDDRARGSNETCIILLGDLVDRGPQSARVIGSARAWANARKVRFLSGNHEEMFLLSFYKSAALSNFLRFGGRATLRSYGIDVEEFSALPYQEAQKYLLRSIPREDREFLRKFETMIVMGDYLFVHAGIRPKVALGEQLGHDCRWIREPFLSHDGDFGHFVVHGHTVTDDVDHRSNRIGIDTGAYQSGLLTALCLEGQERWIIQAEMQASGIQTFTRDLDEREAA